MTGGGYKDPDWLRREYAVECRSMTDIGDEFGVSSSSVLYQLNKHGIETRPRGSRATVEAREPEGPDNGADRGLLELGRELIPGGVTTEEQDPGPPKM